MPRPTEIVALAKVAARHGGFYASHIRDEGVGVLAAIDEALTIGREAKLPVHISHLKASGRRAWGKAGDEIALIEKARRAGQEVTADQYPYTASSTSLSATVVPPRFREGSAKEFLARLDDPDQGPLIRKSDRERPQWPGRRQDASASPAMLRSRAGRDKTCRRSPRRRRKTRSRLPWRSSGTAGPRSSTSA